MNTAHMNYTVYLTDDGDYAAALLLAGGNPLIHSAPRTVGAILGIPYPYPSGNLQINPKTILFYFPFTPGQEIVAPLPTGVLCDDTVDTQLVVAQAGNPPGIWPPGSDVLFVWAGQIVKGDSPPVPPPIPPPGVTIGVSQRRWIEGFEWFGGGDAALWQNYIRDASRTIGGKGYALRGDSGNAIRRTVNELRTTLTSGTSWERFYIRVRALPTGADNGLWRCHGNVVGNSGFALKLDTFGNVRGVSLSGGVETDEGVIFTPTINQWYLVDIFLKYASFGPGLDGRIKVFINHVELLSFTIAGGAGLNSSPFHASSELGAYSGLAQNIECEVDFDDWINADLPGMVNSTTLAMIDSNPNNWPIDFLTGSHVRKQYSIGFTPGGWTGNLGVLNQGDNPLTFLTNLLTSAISGDTFQGSTDALPLSLQDTYGIVFGAVAASVYTYSSNAAATDGQLGYKVAGGASVLTTINQEIIANWLGVGYFPIGLIAPTEISPFSLVFAKSADVNATTVVAVNTNIEYVGFWGDEDDSSGQFVFPFSRLHNLHNCRHENSVWGGSDLSSGGPVYIIGGTYVGNGTYQYIPLPIPCHFLWIRALTGGTNTIQVFGASLGAHYGCTERSLPQNPRIFTDTLGIVKVEISGNDVNLNKAGVTYQYIMFCDPALRFNICGEFQHAQASAVPKVNTLFDPNFTPNAGFLCKQVEATSNNPGLSYKGPMDAGTTGRFLIGTAMATWGTMGMGVINSNTNTHNQSEPHTYSLWRVTETACPGVMVQIFSYVGNGAATQTVAMTPASGRFPIFVLVIPGDVSGSIFRDPSHAGVTSSSAISTALTNNGIRAMGNDTITVGTDLNDNLVVYQVFAFPGSDVAVANGIYYNGICTPLVPPPPILVGNIIVIGNGGVDLGGTGLGIVTIKDVSGIYTIVTNKTHDTLQDRLVGQPTLENEIPNPFFKTGYIGG